MARGLGLDRPRANVEPQPAGDRYFRKSFELNAAANQAHTLVLADNRFQLFVNGAAVGEGGGWQSPAEFDIARHLRSGRNVIAVRATNDEAMAGLFFECDLKTSKGELIHIVTDGLWRTAAKADGEWTAVDYDDSKWQRAAVLGPMGTLPWGRQSKPGDTGSRPPSDRPLPALESMKLFTLHPFTTEARRRNRQDAKTPRGTSEIANRAARCC